MNGPTALPRITRKAVSAFRERVRPRGLFGTDKIARAKLKQLLADASPAGIFGQPCLRARYGNQDVFFVITPDQEAVATIVTRTVGSKGVRHGS